jgi:preprotein translocase subunit YajC
MFDSLILFAEAQVPQQEGGGGDSMFLFFIMLPAILIFLWIFMANPQKKQAERLQKMLDSLEKNDKVMTVGGLIGTVHSIDKEQNEIVLKVDDSNNTRLRFHLTAINAVFPKEGGDKK